MLAGFQSLIAFGWVMELFKAFDFFVCVYVIWVFTTWQEDACLLGIYQRFDWYWAGSPSI
jgi:hypothetical protein